MTEGRHQVSLDFDGVLFRRIPIQDGALLHREDVGFTPKRASLLRVDRLTDWSPLSLKEKVDIWRHNLAGVKPDVARMVRRMKPDRVFGNTGRVSHRTMIDMTMRRLDEAGLGDAFNDIYFRPKGVDSDESKYWALKDLQNQGCGNIFHHDDNAQTVRRLAETLPNVNFVIVQDLTSGILFSLDEMRRYPNVARIALRGKGRIESIHVPSSMGNLPHNKTS